MLVRFLRDYRGAMTKETFHAMGTVLDLPNGEAMILMDQGVVAVVAQAPKPKQQKGRK